MVQATRAAPSRRENLEKRQHQENPYHCLKLMHDPLERLLLQPGKPLHSFVFPRQNLER
jgi:hypothetical protein